MISNSKPYSDSPITLHWYWVSEPGDVVQIEERPSIAQGASPVIELEPGKRLAVIATYGEEEARAELDVEDRSTSQVSLATAVVPLSIDELTVEGLSLSARRGLAPSSGHSISQGGVMRVSLEGDFPVGGRGRFMATGGGTLLEVEVDAADWFNGEFVIDDEEIESRSVGDEGPVTVVAIALGERRSGVASTDLFVGEVPPGVWVSNRFLTSDVPFIEGTVWATLTKDDSSPTGLRIVDVTTAEVADTFDPATVGCQGVSGLFQPQWLLHQHCTRDALEGAQVLLSVTP